MKKIIFLMGLFFAFSMNGQSLHISETDLLGCWKEVKEESTSTLSLYRACDGNTSSSDRYSFSFQLNENGQCLYYAISAKTANNMLHGTWTYDAEKTTIHIINSKGRQVTQFTIQEYASGILKFIKEG